MVFQDQDSNGKNGPEKILKIHAAREVVLQFCVGVNLI